jgi:hypothetical protein
MVKYHNRKLRRWLTLLFMVSLLLNIQSAFACTMMPDMPSLPDMPQTELEDCAHGNGHKAPGAPDDARSDADSCFILESSLQVKGSAESDATPDNDHALVKDKQGSQDLTFSVALLVLAILRVPPARRISIPADDKATHSALPIYQATQRYRI